MQFLPRPHLGIPTPPDQIFKSLLSLPEGTMKWIIATMLALMPIFAHAGEWIADAKSKCQVFIYEPTPSDSVSWSGSCSNGKANGRGTLQWYLNGEPHRRYIGEMRDGKMHGKGILVWTSGDRYEGDWRDDNMNGKGTFVWPGGARYEGEWRGHKKEGFGKQTTPRSAYVASERSNLGSWVGDIYIEQGLFENHVLIRSCTSMVDCKNREKAEYARQEQQRQTAAPTVVTYREGDNVCVMQWQGTGFCGTVDRVSGDRLKVEITNITCGGWIGQCNADPCSGGVSVGPSAHAKVRDFVWTEKYCVTSR